MEVIESLIGSPPKLSKKQHLEKKSREISGREIIPNRLGWWIWDCESKIQVSPAFKITGSWPQSICFLVSLSLSLNSAMDIRTGMSYCYQWMSPKPRPTPSWRVPWQTTPKTGHCLFQWEWSVMVKLPQPLQHSPRSFPREGNPVSLGIQQSQRSLRVNRDGGRGMFLHWECWNLEIWMDRVQAFTKSWKDNWIREKALIPTPLV